MVVVNYGFGILCVDMVIVIIRMDEDGIYKLLFGFVDLG